MNGKLVGCVEFFILRDVPFAFLKKSRSHIDYFDNAPICALVDSQKNGILAALDDSCLAVGKIDDHLLLESMDSRFKGDSHYDSRRKSPTDKSLGHNQHFRIRHYAGPVTYDINGFIDKNRDTLFQDFKRLLYSSKNKVISGKQK